MNKLIKMVTVVASVGAMLSIAGCGSNSPDGVAKSVVSCLKNADIEGMQKYATGDFKKGCAMLKGMVEGADADKVAEFKKDCREKKYEIGEAVVTGDKAEVPVKINGRSKPISLVKEDGQWKVEEFNFKNN